MSKISNRKPFHLAWFLSQGYGPKSWRSDFPGTDVARWMMPDLFVDLAQGMERACFDYVIIEDSSNIPYTYKGSNLVNAGNNSAPTIGNDIGAVQRSTVPGSAPSVMER